MKFPLAPQDHQALANFGSGDEKKLKSYLLMLAAFLESKSPNTKRAYKASLKQFFELFEWICPEDVTPAHVAAFKKWLLEYKCVDGSTAYARMSGVSSFFDFLMKPSDTGGTNLLRSNPFKIIPRNDIQPTPYARAVPMEWATFKSILDATPSDVIGMRDKAILLFFAFTGRRREEVASLRVRDLNLKASPRSYTCRVKGGELKTFELPDVCYDAIKAYWIISDRFGSMTGDSGVFVAARQTPLNRHLDPDRPLNVRTINRILRRCAVRAGLDPDDPSINIHAMRHMAARDLDEAGVRLQDIQAFLGHASPLTTQIYLNRLSGPASAHTDKLMEVRRQAEQLARAVAETA